MDAYIACSTVINETCVWFVFVAVIVVGVVRGVAACHMLQALCSSNHRHFRGLEIVKSLPTTYTALLRELHRRQQYNEQFTQIMRSAQRRLNKLRQHEIRERQTFLSSSGELLPPYFLDVIPSLSEKPSVEEVQQSDVM
jgi:hypothetical protein